MTEISSPVDGVDFRMFEHRSHQRLHRSSDIVAQTRSLQPGSSPGLGSVARGGHDGRTHARTHASPSPSPRLTSRLGSNVRGKASFGTVVGTSEPVTYKPPGAGSSLLCSKGFSAAAGTAACTDSHHLLWADSLSPPLHQSNEHPRSQRVSVILIAPNWLNQT